MTLKKIDEIEAQMSMQWWKTKGPDSLVSTGSSLNSGAHTTGGTPLDRKAGANKDKAVAAAAEAEQQAQRRAAQYNETEAAAARRRHPVDPAQAATQPHAECARRASTGRAAPPAAEPRTAKPESQTVRLRSRSAAVRRCQRPPAPG